MCEESCSKKRDSGELAGPSPRLFTTWVLEQSAVNSGFAGSKLFPKAGQRHSLSPPAQALFCAIKVAELGLTQTVGFLDWYTPA